MIFRYQFLSNDYAGYAQIPVIILPPITSILAGVRLAAIDSDFHRGDETILNFATVC